MVETEDHIIKNPELRQNLGKMLNNPRYSDTVFLVNKTKFNASSHLVCFASPVLESMLDIHYENCRDREIRIGLIKHNESFSIILNFIYGLEINCTKTNLHILCEALSLSEQYKLKIFTEELKSYLSNIKNFQIEFLVVLLNTSKKFHLDDLYDRLILFAYVHADELVKHEHFVDLQYDILRDLLKADNFFTDEINILKSTLEWHAVNMSTRSKTEDGNECNFVKELDDDIDSNNDDEDSKKDDKNGDIKSEETNPDNSTGNENSELENLNPPKITSVALLKEFSRNILKSLLSHIRFTRISVFEIYQLLELESFINYKEYLSDSKCFSVSSKPRVQYKLMQGHYIEKDVQDVTTKFTVDCYANAVMIESCEEYIINNMKWKICIKGHNFGNQNLSLDMFLICRSFKDVEVQDWECTIQCQIKLLQTENIFINLVLPGSNTYSNVTLTSKDSSTVEIGTFYFNSQFWKYSTLLDKYSFEVSFKSIRTKVKVD